MRVNESNPPVPGRMNRCYLASFETASSSWIAEAGSYILKVGASSKKIKQTEAFRLAGDITVRTVAKALSPAREINLLQP